MISVDELTARPLPDGWMWKTMGDIADVVSGGTPSASDASNFENGEIPWLTPADLSGYAAKFVSGGARKLTPKGLQSCSAKLIPAGAVLFTSRAPIGYVAIASNPISTNQGFKNFVLREGVRPEYVYWWLKGAKQLAESLASGTTFLEISGTNAKKLPIPIAPLAKQREIVAELERQFSRLDEAVVNLQRVKANLKRYKASALKAAVEGRSDSLDENGASLSASGSLSELLGISKNVSGEKVRRGVPESVPLSEVAQTIKVPNGWCLRSVAELLRAGAIVDLKDGNHGANHPRTSDFVNTGLPFLTASEVVDFHIDYDSAYKVAGEPLAKLRVGFAEAGDVILTHKGTVGRVAICDRHCVLSPQTTYYRLNASYFSTQYFQYFLASHSFTIQLNAIKSQTTRDYVPISEQYRLFIVCPPLVEQARIVAEVDRHLSIIREVEAEVDANLQRAQSLRHATLAKAFGVS